MFYKILSTVRETLLSGLDFYAMANTYIIETTREYLSPSSGQSEKNFDHIQEYIPPPEDDGSSKLHGDSVL